jgi:hypothetical protein
MNEDLNGVVNNCIAQIAILQAQQTLIIKTLLELMHEMQPAEKSKTFLTTFLSSLGESLDFAVESLHEMVDDPGLIAQIYLTNRDLVQGFALDYNVDL